jgi:hypothetical protein
MLRDAVGAYPPNKITGDEGGEVATAIGRSFLRNVDDDDDSRFIGAETHYNIVFFVMSVL